MKNRVGMPRPKKRKIEEVEATAEDGAEIDCDTGITGAAQPVLDSQSPAASDSLCRVRCASRWCERAPVRH